MQEMHLWGSFKNSDDTDHMMQAQVVGRRTFQNWALKINRLETRKRTRFGNVDEFVAVKASQNNRFQHLSIAGELSLLNPKDLLEG